MEYQVVIDYIKSDSYLITDHARRRMGERSISTNILEVVICKEEIIELYEDDESCPSALILSIHDLPFHVVIGLSIDHVRKVFSVLTMVYLTMNDPVITAFRLETFQH